MRKIFIAIIAFLAVMVFNSCNQEKSAAEKLVKEFMKENLADEDFKIMYCYPMSTTSFISDSIFQQMRMRAAKDTRYKKNIHYAAGPKTKELHFMRVKYKIGNDTIFQTFYLDDSLTRVVSFKDF